MTTSQDVKLQRLPADAEKNVSLAIQWIEGVESYMGHIGSKALLTAAPGTRNAKSDQFFLALLQHPTTPGMSRVSCADERGRALTFCFGVRYVSKKKPIGKQV